MNTVQQKSWTRFDPRMSWSHCVYLRPLRHSVDKILMSRQSSLNHSVTCETWERFKKRFWESPCQDKVRFTVKPFPFLIVINPAVTPACFHWLTLTANIVFLGPKMVAVRNYHGTPAPPLKTPLCFQTGDFIELLKGDPDTAWWEVQWSVTSSKIHVSFWYLWIFSLKQLLSLYHSTLRTCFIGF